MWIKRDFQSFIGSKKVLPIKILKGPRQVGKTSLLNTIEGYRIIYFDDLHIRKAAQENPRLFLDQFSEPLILDEATLAPEIFLELKRRVDAQRRTPGLSELDIWITGSNQTLLNKNVRESLAGRASYFDLNTLSMHELKDIALAKLLIRGGWPELYKDHELDPVQYLNDLILTFIEKDIVAAAGIERREAFSKTLTLIAGRIGQLLNVSDISKIVGVDSTTVKSWLSLLEQNGLLRKVEGYYSNLNQRLIKSPKYFFEDVGLATRLQGWNDILPLMGSPQFGHLVENLAVSEVVKYFSNRGQSAVLYYLRSKEKVEVDLLIELPNNRYVAAEVKATPQAWTSDQSKLLDSLKLNIVDKWILTPTQGQSPFLIEKKSKFKVIEFTQIWDALNEVCK